jgi:hypothetical protein
MKFFLLFSLLAVMVLAGEPALSPPIGQLTTPGWRYEELRRFKAPEAGQGVAVDREFFYAINNHTIGKYRKTTGERVAQWEGGKGGEIIHINAGFVRDGRLYGIHSNFPGVPMLSSLELFDTATLKHVGSQSFGRMDGSFTWLDRVTEATAGRGNGPAAGRWIACFVHYGDKGAEPNRDAAWTQIIAFDDEWRRVAGWALPPDLIDAIRRARIQRVGRGVWAGRRSLPHRARQHGAVCRHVSEGGFGVEVDRDGAVSLGGAGVRVGPV